MWICLTLLNCTLNNGKEVKFYIMCFLPNKNKNNYWEKKKTEQLVVVEAVKHLHTFRGHRPIWFTNKNCLESKKGIIFKIWHKYFPLHRSLVEQFGCPENYETPFLHFSVHVHISIFLLTNQGFNKTVSKSSGRY